MASNAVRGLPMTRTIFLSRFPNQSLYTKIKRLTMIGLFSLACLPPLLSFDDKPIFVLSLLIPVITLLLIAHIDQHLDVLEKRAGIVHKAFSTNKITETLQLVNYENHKLVFKDSQNDTLILYFVLPPRKEQLLKTYLAKQSLPVNSQVLGDIIILNKFDLKNNLRKAF